MAPRANGAYIQVIMFINQITPTYFVKLHNTCLLEYTYLDYRAKLVFNLSGRCRVHHLFHEGFFWYRENGVEYLHCVEEDEEYGTVYIRSNPDRRVFGFSNDVLVANEGGHGKAFLIYNFKSYFTALRNDRDLPAPFGHTSVNPCDWKLKKHSYIISNFDTYFRALVDESQDEREGRTTEAKNWRSEIF